MRFVATMTRAGTIAGLMLIAGCGTVPAPESFSRYGAKDGAFACEGPDGWEKTEGGRADNTYSWVKFVKGGAEIKVMADITGSLFADIGKSNATFGGPPPEPPVVKIHPMMERHMKEEMSNYREKDGVMIKTAGLGEGMRSQFLASGGLGGAVHGYRATALSNDRRVTVICQCPAKSWATLKPAFQKVIASLGR